MANQADDFTVPLSLDGLPRFDFSSLGAEFQTLQSSSLFDESFIAPDYLLPGPPGLGFSTTMSNDNLSQPLELGVSTIMSNDGLLRLPGQGISTTMSNSGMPQPLDLGISTTMSNDSMLGPFGSDMSTSLGSESISPTTMLPLQLLPQGFELPEQALQAPESTTLPSHLSSGRRPRTKARSAEMDDSHRKHHLERNRLAAARCRIKKKALQLYMHGEIERLRRENLCLMKSNEALQATSQQLMNERDFWMGECGRMLTTSNSTVQGYSTAWMNDFDFDFD